MAFARTTSALVITLALGALAGSFADPGPVIPSPEHRMRFCGFGGDREMLEGLRAEWRDLEFCRAYDEGQMANMKALAKATRELGVTFSVQSCAPVFPAGYLEQNKCWAVDFLGRKPADLGVGYPIVDHANPASIAAMKRNLDVAIRDVGASSFTIVDYVWPWVGGRWGYSQADFSAYRAALKGTDGGLRITGTAGDRVLSFWDYFAELSGLRFSPADVGCASWDEYEPVRSPDLEKAPTDAKQRNYFLFHALYHYCWLRFAQECGEYARSLGGELQASLNPENIGNGGDLLTWGRLRGTGEPWLEEWGAAWIAIAGYHNFPYFARAYEGARKRLGLIGETGAAGGHPDNSGFGPARPHYWDPKTNYAITYALGADGQFADREEDYIYASLAETEDPGGPHYDCWRGYVQAMDGFRQYTVDRARRPKSDVLHITNRSVVHYTDNSDYATNQAYSLTQPLIAMHYDYHQGFFPLGRETLDQYKVVLFSPWEYPRDFAGVLRGWLEASPGRVLVTHSFVPARPCKGLHMSAWPVLDEPEAARAFGLEGLRQTEVRSGKITEIAPEWQGVPGLSVGMEVSLPQGLVQCPGRALVKLGEANLVTEVRVGQGRIVYLNFAPPERYKGPDDPLSALVSACLQAILRTEHVSPQAEGSPGWACARYEIDGGEAFLLMNEEATRQPRFTQEAISMAPAGKLSLIVKPDTAYVIYDLLEGVAARRNSDAAGRLPVQLCGWNARLLHVVPDRRVPFIVFTDCERRDGALRAGLPARLYAHRDGTVVVKAGGKVLVDGKAAENPGNTGTAGIVALRLRAGEHTVAVR